MPLYSFECNACNNKFDEQIKLSDLDKAEKDKFLGVACPKCGACAPERLLVNPQHYNHLSWTKWRVDHNK